ncbi:MAG: extracellular solute-binding protein [Lactobacillus sp.]|nr:extracellular solute-binding protein [Lactobacillus sp.]
MKIWNKFAISGAVLLAAAGLAACSKSSNSSSSSNGAKLTLWVDPEQVSQYKAIAKDFEKSHKGISVRVTQSPNGSANAKTDVGKDPSKAADVFEVPNDQLGQMAEAGYINPLSPDATKTIKDENSDVSAQGVSWKGKLYAFPYTVQAQTLYYNKSKFSADDVKDWDVMTKKGVVATDFTNSYVMWPVMFSAGTKLFGDNGEQLKGSTFASQAGINGLKWYAAQRSNKGVLQTSNALNQLKKGNAGAILDGPWNAASIKKILGKNFAVAKYPTITIAGKKVQMQAFLGIKGFAVNANTKNAKAAMSLAQYITNTKSQLIAHKNIGDIPVSKAAMKNSQVTSDPVAESVIEMSHNSVIMPKLPQMAAFWNGAAPLVSGVYDGKIKPSEYKAQLVKLQKATEKK